MTSPLPLDALWVSLGVDATTGNCVRHPTIPIRLATHYTTCRCCASELLNQSVHTKQQNLAWPIQELQRYKNDETYTETQAEVEINVEQEQELESDDNNNKKNKKNYNYKIETNNHDNDNDQGDDEDDELGDEDILDEEDSVDLGRAIQQAVSRAEQWHTWNLLQKEEQIERLQQQLAEQEERIAMLQTTIDKQQKTITQELKMIKAIAKKRAQKRRGSFETTTTSSTPETPSEQPPTLPDRKSSQPHPTNQGIGIGLGQGKGPGPGQGPGQNKYSQSQSQSHRNALLESQNSPSSGSSVPSLPQLPAVAPRSLMRPSSILHTGTMTNNNNNDNNVPPTLPQRLQSNAYNQNQTLDDHSRQDSIDTGAAKVGIPSVHSSQTSGTDALYTHITTPSQSFAISQASPAIHSNFTLETHNHPQKPPQRKLSSRPDPTDSNVESVSRVNSFSTGISSETEEISLNDKGDEHSIEIVEASKHHQYKPSQEIAFVPTKQEIDLLSLPPPHTETPRSVRTFQSIPIASKNALAFDGHATAPVGSFQQQEIQFDATASFLYQKQEPSVHARTSVTHVRFDESQQLLLEASQALHTPPILTPSSVKIRKSLTKKSITKSKQSEQHPRSILPDPPRNLSCPTGTTTAAAATLTTKKSKEIEFSIVKEPQKSKSQLERHLGGGKQSNIGESMHNKTEEQIMQEMIFGKAAVATPEDEADDEYDYFDDVGTVDLPFTNKGYLEYSKDLNLSPVSCLTTVSNVRDGQPEQDEEAMGPRKALHNAGVAKRLPMEDGFDSDDDDDDEDAENGNGDNRGRNKVNHDQGEDQSMPSSQNKNASSSNGSRSTDYQNSNSNSSMNTSQTSLQIDAVFGSTTPRPTTRSKRSTKPVIRVDNDIVQDKYGDEGKYTGTIAMDTRLPHGYGQMKYDNERQYDGEWKGGRWHGYGRWVNPNGDCYEGTFDYDARHGRGVYTWRNGNIYRGEFHEDKRQGKGMFHFANGNVYEGDFVNGVFDGQGRYRFDGGSYEGEWKNGRYHGKGLLIFADGSSYKGEFLDGVAHGHGEERGADGTIRRGIWDNGRPEAAVR